MGYVVVVYVPHMDNVAQVDVGPHGRTVGIYALPSKGEVPVCSGTCPATDRKLNGWGRHPTEGHLVHACGRRHRNWRHRVATGLLDMLGINTLPRAETPLMFQNPPGWGR